MTHVHTSTSDRSSSHQQHACLPTPALGSTHTQPPRCNGGLAQPSSLEPASAPVSDTTPEHAQTPHHAYLTRWQAQRAAIQGVYVGFPITQKYTTKIMCMSQIESTHNGQSVIVVVIPLRQC